MVVDLSLLVRIQLIVDELQQEFKIACAHITSDGHILFASAQSIVSAHSPGIYLLRDYQMTATYYRTGCSSRISSAFCSSVHPEAPMQA